MELQLQFWYIWLRNEVKRKEKEKKVWQGQAKTKESVNPRSKGQNFVKSENPEFSIALFLPSHSLFIQL